MTEHPTATLNPFAWRAVWHVRHADGTEEDIVLEHGNLIEDGKGTAGQVLFERVAAVSDYDDLPDETVRSIAAQHATAANIPLHTAAQLLFDQATANRVAPVED